MFEDFKIMLENMSMKEKDEWICNIKRFNSEKSMLEAKKYIDFDMKRNILTLYKKDYRVDQFLILIQKLNQKNVEFHDGSGNKINKDLSELSKSGYR